MVYFTDNFDSEAEGTSPPTNWVNSTNYTLSKCEVDDAHANSAPHSMLLESHTIGDDCFHNLNDMDNSKWSFRLYVPGSGNRKFSMMATTTDIVLAANVGPFVAIVSKYIRWYDGAYHDSGYNISYSSWGLLEIEANLATDTFDVWYNSVKVITGASFYDGNNLSELNQVRIGFLTSGRQMWIDDVVIGVPSAVSMNNIVNVHPVSGVNILGVKP